MVLGQYCKSTNMPIVNLDNLFCFLHNNKLSRIWTTHNIFVVEVPGFTEHTTCVLNHNHYHPFSIFKQRGGEYLTPEHHNVSSIATSNTDCKSINYINFVISSNNTEITFSIEALCQKGGILVSIVVQALPDGRLKIKCTHFDKLHFCTTCTLSQNNLYGTD